MYGVGTWKLPRLRVSLDEYNAWCKPFMNSLIVKLLGDRDYALQEGPWMIADHYLLVQRWRPNFNPWKADNQKRVAVWVRIQTSLMSCTMLNPLGG
ncbi:hypothetical protein K1719_017873 [Acacia pycnantha]|nr:hypothetical protein K1719_017873 [Acacia pycnantha]